MTKSRGIGRGKHGNHATGPRDDNSDSTLYRNSPHFYLKKYKSTQRPVPCERCGQNAYYKHPEWGNVCAPHLLDLICIWEVRIDWEEYREMWNRCEQLLNRPAKKKPSTFARDMEQPLENQNVSMQYELDGFVE